MEYYLHRGVKGKIFFHQKKTIYIAKNMAKQMF